MWKLNEDTEDNDRSGKGGGLVETRDKQKKEKREQKAIEKLVNSATRRTHFHFEQLDYFHMSERAETEWKRNSKQN